MVFGYEGEGAGVDNFIFLTTLGFMTHHHTVDRIKELLDENQIEYKFYEHPAVRTSVEAASIRPEYRLAQGAKSLLVKLYPREGEPYFAQCVLPGDQQLDAKKLCTNLDIKRMRFMNQGEADTLTDGIEFGGIPPFGNLWQIPVYADPIMRNEETIIFNAGDRSVSIAMRQSDWETIVQPTLVNFIY